MKFKDINISKDGYVFCKIGFIPLDLGNWNEVKSNMDSKIEEFSRLLGINDEKINFLFLSNSAICSDSVVLFVELVDLVFPIPPIYILKNHSMNQWLKG